MELVFIILASAWFKIHTSDARHSKMYLGNLIEKQLKYIGKKNENTGDMY